MKGWIVGLALCLQLTGYADIGEYRFFKSLDGREISAQIIEYDADADRVRLELKNGKKDGCHSPPSPLRVRPG